MHRNGIYQVDEGGKGNEKNNDRRYEIELRMRNFSSKKLWSISCKVTRLTGNTSIFFYFLG